MGGGGGVVLVSCEVVEVPSAHLLPSLQSTQDFSKGPLDTVRPFRPLPFLFSFLVTIKDGLRVAFLMSFHLPVYLPPCWEY